MAAFEWDDHKHFANERKHGVSFEEAATVFLDDDAVFLRDPEHSGEEERYLIVGFNSQARLLVVCHCYRGSDETIRIISARKATARESYAYLQRWAT